MSSQPSIVNIDMKKKSDGDRARKIVFRNEKKKKTKKKENGLWPICDGSEKLEKSHQSVELKVHCLLTLLQICVAKWHGMKGKHENGWERDRKSETLKRMERVGKWFGFREGKKRRGCVCWLLTWVANEDRRYMTKGRQNDSIKLNTYFKNCEV